MIYMPISEARKKFNTIDDDLKIHKVIFVKRHNNEVFCLVDLEFWEVIEKTLDILGDRDSMVMLAEAIQDILNGRVVEQELL